MDNMIFFGRIIRSSNLSQSKRTIVKNQRNFKIKDLNFPRS